MKQLMTWGSRAAACGAFVLCLASGPLVAQDSGEDTAETSEPQRWAKPRTLTDFERAGFTSMEHWQLADLELPAGVQRAPGSFSVSPQLAVFLEDPVMDGLLPAPEESRQEVWTTQRDDGEVVRGSYAVLRYADRVPTDVADFLPALLWGPDGMPTGDHPENLVITGDFVLLLSFHTDDVTGDWLRAQLLERAGLRIKRSWAAQRPQLIELITAFATRDAAVGQDVFYAHADELEENSMAQFFVAEFARWQNDWARAEIHYSWVVYLDQEGIDPFAAAPQLRWSLYDGYGIALLAQRKSAEAVPILTRAHELAEAGGNPEAAAKSDYNLACALSLTGDSERALQSLQSCAAFDPKYREQARRDRDFDALRERADFQAFLGESGG